VSLVFTTPDGEIDWARLCAEYPFLDQLRHTPQDTIHHAEGTVMTHTQMVGKAAAEIARRERLNAVDTDRLLFAAAFHDIGKALTLVFDEAGRPSSPKHASKGAYFLRHFWWERGSSIPFREREFLLSLIARHAWPVRFLEREHPGDSVVRASMTTSNRLLGLLAEADMTGRKCQDEAGQKQAIEATKLYRSYAEELECLDSPREFMNPHCRFTFLSKHGTVFLPFDIFDPTKFEVTLMCGLPGSGKDTWIRNKLPAKQPVLSRDQVRAELKAARITDEGSVIQEVLLRTKQLLAKKQNFTLNATHLRRENRQKMLGLCHAYGARTRVVCLYADRDELLRRNKARPENESLPIAAIDKLAQGFEVPDLTECYTLDLIESGR